MDPVSCTSVATQRSILQCSLSQSETPEDWEWLHCYWTHFPHDHQQQESARRMKTYFFIPNNFVWNHFCYIVKLFSFFLCSSLLGKGVNCICFHPSFNFTHETMSGTSMPGAHLHLDEDQERLPYDCLEACGHQLRERGHHPRWNETSAKYSVNATGAKSKGWVAVPLSAGKCKRALAACKFCLVLKYICTN